MPLESDLEELQLSDAIFFDSGNNLDSPLVISISNISALREARELCFGGCVRLVFSYLAFKFQLNRSTRSGDIVRTVVACQPPKVCTRVQLQSSIARPTVRLGSPALERMLMWKCSSHISNLILVLLAVWELHLEGSSSVSECKQ